MSKNKSRKKVKKPSKKPLALIVLGVTILVAIAITIIVISLYTSSSSKGIPLYTSTSIFGYVNLENSNEYVRTLLSYTNCTNSLCIILFGSKGCPHCHAMYEFFVGNTRYRDICRILWLEADAKAYKLFYNLSQIEISSGIDMRIAGSVPHMLVAKNNSIYTIVVGEVKDEGFWDKLLSSTQTSEISK